MVDRGPANHTDEVAPNSKPGGGEYQATPEYEESDDDEGLGDVASRFVGEIEVEHPVDDVKELFRTKHLQALFHEENHDLWDTAREHENDGTTLYDLEILEVADDCLDYEGIEPSQLQVPERRFKAIFLKKARKPNNLSEFYNYLQTAEPVLQELGYTPEELFSYDSFREEINDRLPGELEASQQQDINAAVTRAIFAVFRNGVEPPETVTSELDFDAVRPPFNGQEVDRFVQRDCLRSWITLLKEETLHPLTFNRENAQIDMLQYLGLFATSALTGSGLQTVPNVADYNYNRKGIPSGSGIPTYIDDLPRTEGQAAMQEFDHPSIVAQFDAVHEATLELADRHGFFDEELSLAIDLYRFDWTGEDTYNTVNRPEKSESDVTSEWTYAVMGVVNNEARFTLGTRWLSEKSQYPRTIKELTPIATDMLDVEAVYADSEMVSGPLIDAVREITEPGWFISAPDEREVVEPLVRNTPRDHIGVVPDVSWNTSPNPALIAYPYNSHNPSIIEFTARELKLDEMPDEPYSSLTDFGNSDADHDDPIPSLSEKFDDPQSVDGVGNASTHAAYFTDRTLKENMAEDFDFDYHQRWAIEESINQIKNDFMPVIESSNPKLRLYGINIAILLQNWHTLINRALSPELGLPRNATHPEFLKAVQDVAFSNTN